MAGAGDGASFRGWGARPPMRIMALTRFAAGGDVIVTVGRKYGGFILECGVKAISGDRLG